jgi:hypothetical protein
VKGKRFLAQPLSSLFQTGGNTSVEQRLEIWKAAFRMALDHPVTGIGPDTFALVYPRYQSASWVAGLGPTYLVNGAHDIFMDVLADQGFVGLVIFLTFLLLIGLRAIGTWRRLRGVEQDEGTGPEPKQRAQAHRLCLAVVSASIVAYLVQAMFNVQQVGLSFLFWALVGTLAALALAAGVPDTLRPGPLVSKALVPNAIGGGAMHAAVMRAGSQEGGASVGQPDRGVRKPTPAANRRRPGGRYQVPWPTVLTAVGITAAVVALAVGGDGPYRADHDYWAADTSLGVTTDLTGTAAEPSAVGQAHYFADMREAISLNPWEPIYPVAEATGLASAATNAPSALDARGALLQAQSLLAKAVADSPLWGNYPAAEAQVDLELATIPSSSARTELSAAVALARQALVDNPRNSIYRQLLSHALAAQLKATAKS